MYSLSILVHAGAAVVALLAAVSVFATGRGRLVHVAALLVMTLTLVVARVVGWSTSDPVARWVFVGLIVLAAAMTVLAWRALRVPLVAGRVGTTHVDLLGFNVISLVEGFAIVAALRAGWPGLAVAALAVGLVVVGHIGLRLGGGAATRRAALRTHAEPAR